MDIGSYYSQSINGFTKNPLLAVPALAGNILVNMIIYGALFLGFFGIYGEEIINYNPYSASTMANPDLGTISLFFVVMVVILIIAVIINILINVATVGMSKRIVLGERPDLGIAWKYIKKYTLKIIAVSIIFGILTAITVIPFILGVILLAADPNGTLGIIGLVIGGLISLILLFGVFLFFVFIYQSVIVGKKSITGSFKDSFKLVKKNFFEVLIVLIINALIIGAISFVVGLISAFLGIIPIIGLALGIIIGIIVNSVVTPYFTLVLNYLYMDLKNMIPEGDEY